MLPELDLQRVQRWAYRRVPARLRDQVRVEVDVSDRAITVFECRPPWNEDVGLDWIRSPVARLRYTQRSGDWMLYWRDGNLRFRRYEQVAPTPNVDELVSEMDEDPTGVFWG